MSLNPGTRLGSYEVVNLIGEGGMGQVYRAVDTNLKRSVALKVLAQAVANDSERLARFQREAEVLASLNHPNIAAIYGLERSGGTTALVMELVEGDDLSVVIARESPEAERVSARLRDSVSAAERMGVGPHSQLKKVGLQVADALAIAKQIAEALEAAHENGIVHRDLKPANVMVRSDGTVKVLDFGLAKALGVPGSDDGSAAASGGVANSPTMTAPTAIGMILGTAAYMSPEQARGKRVDKRADIWAFGCVVYEMLTGRRVFTGEEMSDVFAAVLRQDVDWSALPANTPPRVRALLERCLDRDLKTRLRDIGEARVALGRVNDPVATGPMALPVSKTTPHSRLSAREIAAWTTAALALVAAVTLWFTRAPGTQATASTQILRTMIPPPDDTAFDFDVTVGPAVISPNGTMVAFCARSRQGLIQLWLQSLDSTQAKPVHATEGAQFPFWSPDSGSLGFYSPARGRLERVDLAGGAPVVIAKAGFVRGASWGPDGNIAYDSSDDGMKVSVVNIATGVARAVVTTGSPRAPSILPDGKHLLYYNRDRNQVHVIGLDGTGDQIVTDASTSAIYANGHLLFVRESALIAQPFDLTRLAVTGSPNAIAKGVQMLLGDPKAVFSASDTGILIYQDAGAESAISLAWFDRAGSRQTVVGELGSARGVFLSPDDRFAIVAISDIENRPALWRVSLSNNQRTRLTYDNGADDTSTFAAWSPDGRSVAYGARRNGKILIARMSADGGQEEILFDVPVSQVQGLVPRVTAWSKDGSTIFYSSQTKGGLFGLALHPAGGQPTATALSPEIEAGQNVRLLPNEKWFSFQATTGGSTVNSVFVDAYPGGGHRQPVSERGTIALWSPDGKMLYVAIDNELSTVDVTESGGSIHFGPPKSVMPVMTGRGYSYDVAKDGRILALVSSERRGSRPLTVVQNWVLGISPSRH